MNPDRELHREPPRFRVGEMGHTLDHNRLERHVWNLDRRLLGVVLWFILAHVVSATALFIHIVWGHK